MKKKMIALMLTFTTAFAFIPAIAYAECPHDNTDIEYSLEGDAACTPAGNRVHIVSGAGEIETWCEDCGEMISSEPYVFDGEELPHEYDKNGVCEICGHHNTCSHDNVHEEYHWNDDAVCTPAGSRYHTVTGSGEAEIWCDDCGMMVQIRPCESDGGRFAHEYNASGVCEVCGYRSVLDERVYGSNRYDTALAVADKIKAETESRFDSMIVACGENYPDALSGGYLAWVMDAPMLLVSKSVESKIADYIRKNLADDGDVYLLGGTGAVSSSFENRLKQKGIHTERLGGKDRYETNLKILDAAGVDEEEIMICSGNGYADSLSASAAARPILLAGNTLTDDQKNYIKSLKTEQFYLIGGEGAVSPAIESDLTGLGYSGDSVKRIAGPSRYETSAAVAEYFFDDPGTVVLTYAMNFPDGLSGGPLAMLHDAPIVLTNSVNMNAAQNYVRDSGALWSITLGGPSLITDSAVRKIMRR